MLKYGLDSRDKRKSNGVEVVTQSGLARHVAFDLTSYMKYAERSG